jgi:hypothetical protein
MSSCLLLLSPFSLVPRVLQWGLDGSNPHGAESQRSRLDNTQATVRSVCFGRSALHWSGKVYVLSAVNDEAHCTLEVDIGFPGGPRYVSQDMWQHWALPDEGSSGRRHSSLC